MHSCQAKFICSRLTGSPCGDYGLTVSYYNDGQQTSDVVCHAGHLYEGVLQHEGTIDLALWFVPGARFEATCYLWCSESGSLPHRPGTTFRLSNSLLNSLTNGSRQLSQFELSPSHGSQDPESSYASPAAVYNTVQLRNGSSGSGDCHNGHCSSKYRFQWMGDEACNSTFVCAELGGDPCADYGLSLSHNGVTAQPVCHQGQLHFGNLNTGDYVDISLWYTASAFFGTNCYLWCTEDGNIPDSAQSVHANGELTMSLVSCG